VTGIKLPYTISYQFSQNFNVSAKEAYLWCTDFSPQDPALMSENNVTRKITKLSQNTIILKETIQVENEPVVKRKLVKLYPERLTWISTHINGPNKYAQFLYEVTAKTHGSSQLYFTAQHIEHQNEISPSGLQKLAASLCKHDTNIWKLLAQAMEKELTHQPNNRQSPKPAAKYVDC